MIRSTKESSDSGHRIRLLIACPWGPTDSPATLSGFPYYLIPCLRESFDVHVSDGVSSPVEFGLSARMLLRLQKGLSTIRPYRFPGSRDVIARSFSEWLSGEVQRVRPDAVLTFGCAPVAYYCGNAPVFLYIDSLYLYKARVYGWVNEESLPKYEYKSMRNVDILGLENCYRALFTSRKIANESKALYPAHMEKMHAVGIGSNLDYDGTGSVNNRPLSDGLNLLFLSTNFERKGGAFALQVLEKLQTRRPPVRLHIVGDYRMPETALNRDDVIYHGWIDKSSADERRRLLSILQNIHISLLPTQGDLTPHSICEMNSLGIPTIANNVGGIADLIEDGVSGRVMGQLNPENWAEAVLGLLGDITAYSDNARKLYEREQRWPEVAAKIANEINCGLVKSGKS